MLTKCTIVLWIQQLQSIFYVDFSVTLDVLTPMVSVLEMNVGEQDMVHVCFMISSQLNQTLNRDATFQFAVSNLTTARLESDFIFTNSSSFTLPAGSSGDTTCIKFTIIGDNLVENDEVIVYDVLALDKLDQVAFPNDTESLRIEVLDNDGQ